MKILLFVATAFAVRLDLEDPDCISDTHVDCSTGCSDDMLGNGICDSACDVYTC